MRRRRWLLAAVCVVALSASGCIGAVERDGFEHELRSRGGGLVNGLTASAVAAVRERLGTTDFQANVLMLTAPDSMRFRLVLNDQPNQVTRFLSAWPDPTARQATVRLRVRNPDGSRRLDDYSFTLGALSAPRPVRVSAFDDIDGEGFAISEVPGLARIEDIVDTALTRSGLGDGQVTVLVVSRFGRDVRIVANVASPRTELVAEFDHTGAFLRIQQV
ncbi:hypothetical protein [Nocardia sp. NPDC052566]|uniref:hypothetical protein n=1 Tax=Nocardia sp. NPDC052566 TaxID=3364330 RepID=UPI0037CAC1EE